MSELLELRKISIEFRRLSSNFLKTTYDDNFLYIKRLHSYIEKQPEIQTILNDIINNSEYDCSQFIVQADYEHKKQISVPIEEADHIKAMYYYLSELANNESVKLLGIANSFHFTSSNKFNDIIQAYLEKVFKPLIDFIVDSLSKEMMILEQPSHSSPHIENNYGIANIGERNYSTNTVNQSSTEEVLRLLSTLRTEATNSLDNKDEKESVDECLEVIESEVKSSKPKRSMIKTAISTLQAIKGSAEFAAAVVALVQFFQEVF